MLDGTEHIQSDDVARPLPDGVHVDVAKQPRLRPVLDEAVAAAHLHRLGGGNARAFGAVHLEQGREQAHRAVRVRVAAALRRVGELADPHRGGESGQSRAHDDDAHAGRPAIFVATAAGVGAARKSSNDNSAP